MPSIMNISGVGEHATSSNRSIYFHLASNHFDSVEIVNLKKLYVDLAGSHFWLRDVIFFRVQQIEGS